MFGVKVRNLIDEMYEILVYIGYNFYILVLRKRVLGYLKNREGNTK